MVITRLEKMFALVFSLCLGQHKGMPAGHRSLLYRRLSALSYDRPVIQIEDHRQKHLFADHAFLADRCALGRR